MAPQTVIQHLLHPNIGHAGIHVIRLHHALTHAAHTVAKLAVRVVGAAHARQQFRLHVHVQIPDATATVPRDGRPMLAERRMPLVAQRDDATRLQRFERPAHRPLPEFGRRHDARHARPRAGTVLMRELREIQQHRLLRCGTEVQAVHPSRRLKAHIKLPSMCFPTVFPVNATPGGIPCYSGIRAR